MSHILTVPAPLARRLESGERLRSDSFFFSERGVGDVNARRKPSVKFSLDEPKPPRGTSETSPERLLEEDEELMHHRH